MPSLYCRLCRVKTRMVVGKFRFSIRVSAVTTLITHKVCSASRLAADITFFTSHVDPFKVVRLSEFKSKKSMTMKENSARTLGVSMKTLFPRNHTTLVLRAPRPRLGIAVRVGTCWSAPFRWSNQCDTRSG